MTAGVVTGEAVALDVRLAHWPSRLVALVIDALSQLVLFFFLAWIASQVFANVDSALQATAALLILVFVIAGYPVILETLWRGRSLGKAALGLRVVRDDGGPERFRHALIRGVLLPLEIWGPGLIASIISKRGKRFGDLLAGTIVVQERVPGRTAGPVAMPPPLAWWATTLDLSRLGDDLALSCRQFLGRQHELNPAARDQLGTRLVAAVQAVVTPPPPNGTPGWAYLSAVVAERRRREEQRLAGLSAPFAAAPVHVRPPAPVLVAPAPPPPASGPFAPPQ